MIRRVGGKYIDDANVDGTENRKYGSIIVLLQLDLSFVPLRNDYGETGELSRGNELLNALRDRSRWVDFLQEKALKGG